MGTVRCATPPPGSVMVRQGSWTPGATVTLVTAMEVDVVVYVTVGWVTGASTLALVAFTSGMLHAFLYSMLPGLLLMGIQVFLAAKFAAVVVQHGELAVHAGGTMDGDDERGTGGAEAGTAVVTCAPFACTAGAGCGCCAGAAVAAPSATIFGGVWFFRMITGMPERDIPWPACIVAPCCKRLFTGIMIFPAMTLPPVVAILPGNGIVKAVKFVASPGWPVNCSVGSTVVLQGAPLTGVIPA